MNAPTTFSKNGFEYRLLLQKGKIGLYEARSQTDRGPRAFEVVIVRAWPERTITGKVLPAGPRLPSNEEWGIWGWSYDTAEAAERKFTELNQRGLRGS